LETMVSRAVKHWDQRKQPAGSFSAALIEEEGAKLNPGYLFQLPVKQSFVSEASLRTILRDYKKPFAALLTGIPQDVNYDKREWTGNTFAASFLPSGLWSLDTHAHPRAPSGPRGMVLAHLSVKPSQPYDELLDAFVKWFLLPI
jgi:hypothetical protein